MAIKLNDEWALFSVRTNQPQRVEVSEAVEPSNDWNPLADLNDWHQ